MKYYDLNKEVEALNMVFEDYVIAQKYLDEVDKTSERDKEWFKQFIRENRETVLDGLDVLYLIIDRKVNVLAIDKTPDYKTYEKFYTEEYGEEELTENEFTLIKNYLEDRQKRTRDYNLGLIAKYSERFDNEK